MTSSGSWPRTVGNRSAAQIPHPGLKDGIKELLRPLNLLGAVIKHASKTLFGRALLIIMTACVDAGDLDVRLTDPALGHHDVVLAFSMCSAISR